MFRPAVAGLVIGACVSIGAWAPCPAFAATASDIAVVGNRRVEADTIRSYFHVGPGHELDAAALDAALKALYATGQFKLVQISHQGPQLLVKVAENPVIGRVAFEGNSKLKDDQIKKELQSKERGPFMRANVQGDVQHILELYRRSGRFDAEVVPKIIEKDDRVDLVFEIKEGGRTGVRQIVFAGNNAYRASDLKAVIKTGRDQRLELSSRQRSLRS